MSKSTLDTNSVCISRSPVIHKAMSMHGFHLATDVTVAAYL